MNTVFIVKNSAFEFMEAPEEVNIDWISNILSTRKIQTTSITDELFILQSANENDNITYKVKVGNHSMKIKGNFMLLRKTENLLLPLNENLEDYIVDSIKISRC